ncbi:adenylate/guanylate cyclase domain-containing protein [Horticoccus luteus]|uniref:Adenylate/guanylate cyclase domain-containing protein n=1 Tax=Horticoccus luteus TaxID=2862869 RepID=A0A8F9XHJ2_9BACT|nr:adenylate/guanylate cyclase domain-containing protein [Horticoccus luteus]QYM80302.1 adenylate/guanylate cyclase domain-containing protein [Horticoccus luteus]
MAWALAQTELLQGAAWRVNDAQVRWRTLFQHQGDPRIAISLFEDSTEELVSWPPDREYHATLLGLLAADGTAVVAWDVILDAQREGEGDERLVATAGAAREAGTGVVVGAVSDPGTGAGGPTLPDPADAFHHVEGDVSAAYGDVSALLPFPALRSAARFGFVDAPRSGDGVIRQIPLVVRIGDRLYPSFALQTVLAYLHVTLDQVTVKLGEAVSFPTPKGVCSVPIDREGKYLINYRYEHDDLTPDYATYTYRELLLKLKAKLMDGKPLPGREPQVEGKILLVGQTVTGKADAGPSQRSSYTPLVLVHANVIDNILNRDFIRRPPGWVVWGGLLLLGYAGLTPAIARTLRLQLSFGVLVIVAYASVVIWGFVYGNWWVPVVGPMMGYGLLQFVVIGGRVLREQKAKDQLKQMFNSYLSPELLKKILRGKSLAEVSSERKPVTILFSDLRDFTSWSEQTKEETLIAQLNEYLAAMVECIHAHGGTLHKFIGDAVMAVWGDLVSEGPATDAQRACEAALAMQERLNVLNERWAAAGEHTLRMGIGLNHGVVLVGNIGSPRRMEFTVIGDAVNLASRLESLNKELKTGVLVGGAVYELVRDHFEFRECGAVPVKGKREPVPVFELCALKLTGSSASRTPVAES